MLTLGQTLSSKTFWVNFLAFATAGYGAVSGALPPVVNQVISTAVPLVTMILKIFFTKQVPQ